MCSALAAGLPDRLSRKHRHFVPAKKKGDPKAALSVTKLLSDQADSLSSSRSSVSPITVVETLAVPGT